ENLFPTGLQPHRNRRIVDVSDAVGFRNPGANPRHKHGRFSFIVHLPISAAAVGRSPLPRLEASTRPRTLLSYSLSRRPAAVDTALQCRATTCFATAAGPPAVAAGAGTTLPKTSEDKTRFHIVDKSDECRHDNKRRRRGRSLLPDFLGR